MNKYKNLMFDLSMGREIYDAENDRVVSTTEANDTLVAFCREELGISKDSTHREIKRALESEKGKQLFQIIEEVIDDVIATGFRENEFFNQFVETKNLADGDENEFWVEGNEVILTVAKVAGSHHDLNKCRVRVA